jgi:hypothetical protein
VIPMPLVAFPCGSRSTSRTRRSARARYVERLMTVVVLPTPPFWFAQAITTPTQQPRRFTSTNTDSIGNTSDRGPIGEHDHCGERRLSSTYQGLMAASSCCARSTGLTRRYPLSGPVARSVRPRPGLRGRSPDIPGLFHVERARAAGASESTSPRCDPCRPAAGRSAVRGGTARCPCRRRHRVRPSFQSERPILGPMAGLISRSAVADSWVLLP